MLFHVVTANLYSPAMVTDELCHNHLTGVSPSGQGLAHMRKVLRRDIRFLVLLHVQEAKSPVTSRGQSQRMVEGHLACGIQSRRVKNCLVFWHHSGCLVFFLVVEHIGHLTPWREGLLFPKTEAQNDGRVTIESKISAQAGASSAISHGWLS